MACPYFRPTRRLSPAVWRCDVRPPLGEAYEGECHATPEQALSPPGELLLSACNLGYPAQACKYFRPGGPEAVRFSIQKDAAQEVSIAYVVEQGHLPHEHGELVYDRGTESWSGPTDAPLLRRQAEAYLESYLSWREQHPRQRKASA